MIKSTYDHNRPSSSSSCRPLKRTYQRKKPSLSALPVRRRKPLQISFISPEIISPPAPPPPLKNISVKAEEKSSFFKDSPSLSLTPNSSSSLHVKHTSNDLFDMLLKQDQNEKHRNDSGGFFNPKILKIDPKLNLTTDSSEASLAPDQPESKEAEHRNNSSGFFNPKTVNDKLQLNLDTDGTESPLTSDRPPSISDEQTRPKKKLADRNKKKKVKRKKDIKLIDELFPRNAENSAVYRNLQLEVENVNKRREDLRNVKNFRYSSLDNSSDQSSCERQPKFIIHLNDSPLISSTPCQKSAKHFNKMHHISPISISPFDSFNKESDKFHNQSSVIISSPPSDYEKSRLSDKCIPKVEGCKHSRVHSNNSIKTSPILFDSNYDMSTNPISDSFYQQSTRELKFFSPEKNSKADSLKKLKSLINDAESSIENQNTDSLNKINETEKNTSEYEKSIESLRNLDFVTTRRSRVPDISNSIIDSSVFGISPIHSSAPRKSMYCAGKKWRRSINYINQMKKLSMMNNIPEAISNDEGFLGFKKKKNEEADGVYSYVKNRRSTIVFKEVPLYSEEKMFNATKKLESILEQSQSVSCDGLPPDLVDLSKLTLSEYFPEGDEKLNEISDRNCAAREVVLRKCGQSAPVDFECCYPDSKLKNCHKIGEGVYGEVFLFKNPDDPSNPSVIKIIPVEGDKIINGDRQKKYEEIVSEIIIATELSSLRQNDVNNSSNFVRVLQVKCVRGAYPEKLLDLWELYEETHGTENDCPSIFTSEQLYVILELANCGIDLEAFKFDTAEQSYSVFIQVAFALSVAEEAYQFEHRDLHWGNVLVSPTDKQNSLFMLRGNTYAIPSNGVFGSIIDYTLSRISLPDSNINIYNDLAKDPDLFDGEGDYQFDVYRHMRDKIRNEWHVYEPYTNILWLDYLLDKLIHEARYNNAKLKSHNKTHQLYMSKLLEIKDIILQYDSCIEFVTCNFDHLECE